MPRIALALLLGLLPIALEAAPLPDLTKETATPKKAASPEQIAKAIQDLGSGRFALREQASKFLWEAGNAAEAALRDAAKSTDAEVATRAKAILHKFDLGIYPDTPKKVVEIVESYEKGSQEDRARAIGELLQVRPIPFKPLRRLIAKEDNAQLRALLFEQMAEKARTEVPDMLVNGDLRNAEELLETCVGGASGESAADYAAFMALTGKLDAAIARWEKTRADKSPEADRAAEVLAFLYRAKGDWPAARKAASQSKNDNLETDLLWEEGNWKELAKRSVAPDRGNVLGVRLALARLGEPARFETVVQEVVKAAEDAEADPAQIREAADALLLNGRAAEGIKLLAEKKIGMGMAFDLLCARMQHKAAFELVNDARRRDTDPTQRFEVEVRRARMLYMLGDKESAIQLFGKAAEEIGGGGADMSKARTLVRTEVRSGLRDLAYDHAALALAGLAKLNQHDGYSYVLEPLFDKNSESADIIWRVLRQKQLKDEPQQAMRRLRDLFAGKADASLRAEVNSWLESEKELSKEGEARVVHPVAAASAIAEINRLAGDDAKAEKAYQKAVEHGGPDALIRYGDFLVARKRWRDAAVQYHKAWEINKSQSLGLYLEARALQFSGNEKEAARLAELAHIIPLGNEYVRVNLVDELSKRDWPEAANREANFIVRACWYREALVGNVMAHLARAASRDRQFSKAADYYEKALLGCLRTGASFVEPTGYLAVPEAVRVNRALGLLGEKKFDEALKLAEGNLEVMPGNIELVIPLVPELEKLGRKKEADDLYERVKAVYEQLCKDYPGSAYARNSAAWLMANCRRDLDAGRKHAERAVEIEPKNAGYLDTLAEVHFRLGNKDKAIAMMKQCIELDGRNRYFKKQLERFQTKGPDSPTPDESEDDE